VKKFLVIALFAFTMTLMGQEAGEHGAVEAAEPSIVWVWVNFVILAGALGYLAVKHLPKIFADRSSEIQKNITEAQQVKRDAEARAAQMEARLKALGADIETFRKQAATEMQQEGERIRQETVAQIKKVEQQAALEIESAGKAATRELRKYSAELALKLAEERVRARLDASSESALVERFVKELGSAGSKN
jgi:F-type H+-transporting ATPase subunit b